MKKPREGEACRSSAHDDDVPRFHGSSLNVHTGGVCGRFALDLETDQLIDAFVIDHNRFPDWAPRWNIAPTTIVPLVIDTSDNGSTSRVLGPARWSLTPSWSTTLELKYPTFNARAESALEKPTFRESVAHHRGLIPATAYYEWRTEDGVKIPYAIRPSDGEPFAFAALYSTWGVGPERTVTATILTRDAPEHISWIHPRCPVPLSAERWQWWLDPQTLGTQQMLDEAVVASEDPVTNATAYPVAPLRGDGPELLQPAR